MGFEDDPRDEIQSFPCDCGGEITEEANGWFCDKCGWTDKEEVKDDRL